MSAAGQTAERGNTAERPLRGLGRTAVVFGAWLFTLGSLFPVYGAIGSDSDRFYIMHAHVGPRGQQEHKSVGLTYEGPAGQRLARVQLVAVCVAAFLSVLPQTWPRRIGRAALTAWCALWLVNAVRFCLAAPFWVAYVVAVLTAACFACVLLYTARGWPHRETAPPLGPAIA